MPTGRNRQHTFDRTTKELKHLRSTREAPTGPLHRKAIDTNCRQMRASERMVAWKHHHARSLIKWPHNYQSTLTLKPLLWALYHDLIFSPTSREKEGRRLRQPNQFTIPSRRLQFPASPIPPLHSVRVPKTCHKDGKWIIRNVYDFLHGGKERSTRKYRRLRISWFVCWAPRDRLRVYP